MSFWESVKAFVSREAADAKEGLENLRDKFDAEMTKRETELEATPSERLDMIREDIESSGPVFDDIEAKIDDRLHHDEAVEEATSDPGPEDSSGSGSE